METHGYRVRFRFRVQKTLTIKEPNYSFKIGSWDAKLSSPNEQLAIADSNWLIINVRGIPNEEQAIALGQSLKRALQISSAATRQGVDDGVDLATSGIGETVREAMLQNQGVLVRDNVHGIDVFPDLDNVRIFNISGTGKVSKAPEPFLTDLGSLVEGGCTLSKSAADVILLLNFALMRAEPVAQIVFAVSAVEMLGQDQDWTADQAKLLTALADQALASDVGTSAEREEVASAIRKSLHKLTLRQGVMRLLDSLGLPLRKEWDALYKERSRLVHGLAPEPGADYSTLAFRTVSLCGRILLAAVAREVPAAAKHLDQFYPVEP